MPRTKRASNHHRLPRRRRHRPQTSFNAFSCARFRKHVVTSFIFQSFVVAYSHSHALCFFHSLTLTQSPIRNFAHPLVHSPTDHQPPCPPTLLFLPFSQSRRRSRCLRHRSLCHLLLCLHHHLHCLCLWRSCDCACFIGRARTGADRARARTIL